MGIFSGPSSGGVSGLSALAGLGFVAVPSKSAKKVVSSFLLGRAADGACEVPKKGQHRSDASCHYKTDGDSLSVHGRQIAKRYGGLTTGTIEVCVSPDDPTPELRQAVNALLGKAKVGVSVYKRKGSYRIAGRKGRTGADWPGCVKIQLNKKMTEAAEKELLQRYAERVERYNAPGRRLAKIAKSAKKMSKRRAKGRKSSKGRK